MPLEAITVAKDDTLFFKKSERGPFVECLLCAGYHSKHTACMNSNFYSQPGATSIFYKQRK